MKAEYIPFDRRQFSTRPYERLLASISRQRYTQQHDPKVENEKNTLAAECPSKYAGQTKVFSRYNRNRNRFGGIREHDLLAAARDTRII